MALKLSINVMSRSTVTLTKGFFITRPATLLIFDSSWTLASVSRALNTPLLATVTQGGSIGLKSEFRLLLS